MVVFEKCSFSGNIIIEKCIFSIIKSFESVKLDVKKQKCSTFVLNVLHFCFKNIHF